VPEVTHPGKQHGQPCFVGSGNHLIVADRSARLDHCRCTGFGRGKQSVGEWEKGVRSDR
jgi:hypothetical protein